jgi:hypothetical protein
MINALLAAALILQAGLFSQAFADGDKTPRPDEVQTKIVSEYLSLEDSLVGADLSNAKKHAGEIERLTTKLSTEDMRDEPVLRKAALKISRSKSLGDAKEAFKNLSKPIVGWVEKEKRDDLEVNYCPMAKANWVQRKGEVKNPFFGKDMLSCGKKGT